MIAFPLFVFSWLNAAGCVTAAATATADPSPASSLSAFQWLRFARDKSQRVSVCKVGYGGQVNLQQLRTQLGGGNDL